MSRPLNARSPEEVYTLFRLEARRPDDPDLELEGEILLRWPALPWDLLLHLNRRAYWDHKTYPPVP